MVLRCLNRAFKLLQVNVHRWSFLYEASLVEVNFIRYELKRQKPTSSAKSCPNLSSVCSQVCDVLAAEDLELEGMLLKGVRNSRYQGCKTRCLKCLACKSKNNKRNKINIKKISLHIPINSNKLAWNSCAE